MILRPYQQRVIDVLYSWWMTHPGVDEAPLLVLPTGAGKSVVIAELTRLLFDTWPDDHPRTVILVPSKELAEQNADKLVRLLPTHIRVGYYSAALGRKVPNADVIVATIGSIYRDALLLGNIRCVIIDEAHLVNPDGAEAGRYRKFLADLAKVCTFRVVGTTATPFRGNGVWLTDGDAPLFTGVAATVTVRELLDANHLAPLVRPVDVVTTKIDTAGIKTTSGDYNLGELAECVETYLPACAAEACKLAADRRKWIAFLPTVTGAGHFVHLLNGHGISAALVCGDTPKADRERLIAEFRAGQIRCLVTVLALATGFDVPDVDCILWLRPTISPVLYVQGAGRGLRPAPGKTDCLWVDFSDTTERMGPVDAIKGRKRRAKQEREAPCKICDECGERVQPRAIECPSCGFVFPEPEPEHKPAIASSAAIMSHQLAPQIARYEVTRVEYGRHSKSGSPDSLRVDYYAGLRRVCSEWVCLEHQGFARAKAEAWWRKREPRAMQFVPGSVDQALDWITSGFDLTAPTAIVINESGKWPEIVGFEWIKQPELLEA